MTAEEFIVAPENATKAIDEIMELYATDRLDSYKEAQRQAIEERIQHLERLMADGFIRCGTLISRIWQERHSSRLTTSFKNQPTKVREWNNEN